MSRKYDVVTTIKTSVPSQHRLYRRQNGSRDSAPNESSSFHEIYVQASKHSFRIDNFFKGHIFNEK